MHMCVENAVVTMMCAHCDVEDVEVQYCRNTGGKKVHLLDCKMAPPPFPTQTKG